MKILNYTDNLIREITGYIVQQFPIQTEFPVSKYKKKKIPSYKLKEKARRALTRYLGEANF